jgi:hypothetical protein
MAASMMACTLATASSSGLIWSSMLAPTTPTPMALRMVPAGSPYPASRSAVTGSVVASTMRPTASIIVSTGIFSPSG